jgi:hypothetical protein
VQATKAARSCSFKEALQIASTTYRAASSPARPTVRQCHAQYFSEDSPKKSRDPAFAKECLLALAADMAKTGKVSASATQQRTEVMFMAAKALGIKAEDIANIKSQEDMDKLLKRTTTGKGLSRTKKAIIATAILLLGLGAAAYGGPVYQKAATIVFPKLGNLPARAQDVVTDLWGSVRRSGAYLFADGPAVASGSEESFIRRNLKGMLHQFAVGFALNKVAGSWELATGAAVIAPPPGGGAGN